MDATIAQLALDAVVVALNTDAPSDIPPAEPGQWFPGDPIREPRLRVFFFNEESQPVGGSRGPLNKNDLVLVVQCICAAEQSATADVQIEFMRAWVTKALGTTNLGGLIHEVQYRGTKWERQRLEMVTAWAAMGWSIRFQTARGDMTRRS